MCQLIDGVEFRAPAPIYMYKNVQRALASDVYESEYYPDQRTGVTRHRFGWNRLVPDYALTGDSGSKLTFTRGAHVVSPSGPGIMGYLAPYPGNTPYMATCLIPEGALVRMAMYIDHVVVAAERVHVVDIIPIEMMGPGWRRHTG